MSNIILLNGPKSCGKSEFVKNLLTQDDSFQNVNFKDHLVDLTAAFFDIDKELYLEIYNNRIIKETPLPNFTVTWEAFSALCKRIDGLQATPDRMYGYDTSKVMLSVRQAMIYVSECIVKPSFGSSRFGEVLARKLEKGNNYVEDSTAFVEEIEPVVTKVGEDNILLIRIHRPGFTFDGDSRNYLPDDVVKNTIDVYNNSTEQAYLDEMFQIVSKFIEEKR